MTITLGLVELIVIGGWWLAIGTLIGRDLERRRIVRSVMRDDS